MEKQDYLSWIRSKVGHDKIFFPACGAIIEDETGRILLQQRSDFGTWGIIGGMIEPGERFEETLRREIYEETGMTQLSIIGLLDVDTNPEIVYPNGDKVQTIDIVYLVKALEPLPKRELDDETLALEWVDPDHIDNYPLAFPTHVAFIHKYLQNRRLSHP